MTQQKRSELSLMYKNINNKCKKQNCYDCNSIGSVMAAKSLELKHTIRLISELDAEIEEIENEIESIMATVHSPITTIPGIGARMGAMILAEVGDFSNFDSADKILAYAGMSPSTYQSGQLKNCYAHMEKRGSRYLRYAIFNATKYVCHWDEKFKKLSSAERKKRRQTVVKPRVDAFFAWAKAHATDTGKKDKTASGFEYCINNEVFLRRFLEDGEIPIDNSATERAIRPFTVSRKTWKLIDTPSGADASAIMYSIVETARANNLQIYEYFKYLLEELPKHQDDTNLDFLDDLLPRSGNLPQKCISKKTKK